MKRMAKKKTKQNNNFARASCFFSSDMEIPNFMHLLYGFSEHSTKISFFFPHFHIQVRYFQIQPQRISLIFNKIKLNKIDEV